MEPKEPILDRLLQCFLFPAVVVTIVGTVWVAAWSRDLQQQASRRNYPALPMTRLIATEHPDSLKHLEVDGRTFNATGVPLPHDSQQ